MRYKNKILIKGIVLILLLTLIPYLSEIIRGKFVVGYVKHVDKIPVARNINIVTTYPVISYKVNNKSYTFKAAENIKLEKHEKVKVLYLPGKPKQAKVYSFTGFWLSYLITLVVGIIFWWGFVLSFSEKKLKKMLRLK
jgi:hypothetical protein